jgi:hypothetical protein
MVKTSQTLILRSNYDTIFLYFLRTLKNILESQELPISLKNKTMNKTTLSPIIAGTTMNWGLG